MSRQLESGCPGAFISAPRGGGGEGAGCLVTANRRVSIFFHACSTAMLWEYAVCTFRYVYHAQYIYTVQLLAAGRPRRTRRYSTECSISLRTLSARRTDLR